jgi:23S rRNA (uracil1939-C5)-methyltransferase
MSSQKLITLEITDLAYDGQSVGHLDGKVVFCNGGLPGETILAEIIRSKPRYDKAVIREIIKKSDARIEPDCRHFDHCGGCSWQDLAYSQQVAYKKAQVIACLQRLADLGDVEVADVIESREQFYYRNKMEFSFHVTGEGSFNLGLHRQGRFDEIFDIDECFLQSKQSNRIVSWVREFVARNQIPIYDVLNHTGFMRFLVIREGKRTGQVLVNLVTNFGDMPSQQELVTGLCESIPDVTTIVHNQNGRKSNIAIGEIETVLYGPGFVEEEINNCRFRILSNSFFQTNPAQAEVMYNTAFEMLQARPTDRLLDLYCGTGAISILVSSSVAEVVGVELVSDAVRIALENAEINKVSNVTFFEGNVKDFLASEDVARKPFDIVVIDPPRAGLHPKALKRVIKVSPEKLLYISCNPATFARDAKEITAGGYDLPKVIPVDMFPHTKHIELVGLFHRK